MEARITFVNGDVLRVEKNGDCFINSVKIGFPDDLTLVVVQSDEGVREYHNAQVQECAALDGRFWFTFVEESEQARTIRELREENEVMAGAILELAELIGGME